MRYANHQVDFGNADSGPKISTSGHVESVEVAVSVSPLQDLTRAQVEIMCWTWLPALFTIYIPAPRYNVTLLCGSLFPSPVMQGGYGLINTGWEAYFLALNIEGCKTEPGVDTYTGNFKHAW